MHNCSCPLLLAIGFTNVNQAQVIPEKDFEIYMVPHSHADLSWPDTPEICTNLNVQAIKKSIEILKDLKEFKFSEEDVFVLQEFLRRYPSQIEEVRELFKKNILECGAFYMGPSELLLGGEGTDPKYLFWERGGLRANSG